MVKPPPRWPDWTAASSLAEAQKGDPSMLIARLKSFIRGDGTRLSNGELEFITKALEATAGKRYDDNLNRIEEFLITAEYEALQEGDVKRGSGKRALEEVMRTRGYKERQIYKKIEAFKKRESKRT